MRIIMTKQNTNNSVTNCCEVYDDHDYSKNISVKNKEVEVPKIYTINFFHNFDYDINKYKPYFDVFDKAKENDEIVIYINSGGGCISTLNVFLNAIKICKCKNITARVNYAASAATILMLACDNIVFNENTELMFHTYSNILYGKSQEIGSEYKFSDEHCKKVMNKYLKKIMSDKEIEELHNGKDFYFNETEAITRLKKYTLNNKKGKRK